MTGPRQSAASTSSRDAVLSHLSSPRLEPYAAATDGSRKSMLRLYAWNIHLSGALYEALHVVEVVVRNSIDVQLSTWNTQQFRSGESGAKHTADWSLDPARLLQRLLGSDLEKARSHAKRAVAASGRSNLQVLHSDVVAQLTFGTWRFLLPSKDQGRQFLWSNAIRHSFPGWMNPSRGLVDRMDRLHKLRNRVAHLEPLLQVSPGRRLTDMREILESIDKDVATWFVSQQRVTTVAKDDPRRTP